MKCPVFKQCGGCSYQHNDYPAYLDKQQNKLHDLLSSFAQVRPILAMKDPFYYRNKVQAVVSVTPKGQVITGNYKEQSHKVVSVDHCLIEDKTAQAIIHSVRQLIPSFKWTVYNEDAQRGLIRHILVRTGYKTGEVLLVIVVADKMVPGKANFVKAIRKKHPEIVGVVFNLNERKTSMVLGPKDISFSGKNHLYDELLEKKYRLSAGSFYQVNPVQTEVLYRTAIDLAQLKPSDVVIDAYSGIGTIALSLADNVKQVYAVESNREAVRDAIFNAKLNNVTNVQFFHGDATEWIHYLPIKEKDIDCLIVDPPRAGCEEAFLKAVETIKPQRMIYVSCNPETLKRDLDILSNTFHVEAIQPVDMFPWTEHVECVVLMSRVDK